MNRTVWPDFGPAVQPHPSTRRKFDRDETHLTVRRQVVTEGIACCGPGVDSYGVFIHNVQESRGTRQQRGPYSLASIDAPDDDQRLATQEIPRNRWNRGSDGPPNACCHLADASPFLN
jgi:hypothetical protein